MKRTLPIQQFLIIMAVLFAINSQAQNKISTTDDQQKLKQLKHYVESHALPKGQTSWAVETLKKYETGLTHMVSSKINASPVASYRAAGGPPANDDCANATLLIEQTSCISATGDVAASTQSMPADSCNTYISDSSFDVWYQFVAVTSNPYITVAGSASFDAVVFLFDACGGSILGCSDATLSGEPETIVSSGLIPGNTYYIRVYDYGTAIPNTTTFDICVFNAPPPPVNDECANAILLTEGITCVPVPGDLAWATQSMPSETCGIYTSDSSYDVWYRFVAVTANPLVSITGSASFDPVIFLLDGCNGSVLACSDTSASGGTEIFEASGLLIGTTYYLRVYDYGGALPATTMFDLCVYAAPVGIADIYRNNIPSLYPNPANGIFTVSLGITSQKTSVEVYDVLGSKVKEQLVLNSKETVVDASSLPAGVYAVKVQNETGIFTQKIILNK
jgi:hypothetical protein